LGDLSRGNDTTPEVFLAHKDALLAHLRDFHLELQRFTPLLREGVRAVEATGLERLVEAAAEADDRPFRTYAERLDDWRQRWIGLRAWFAPSGFDVDGVDQGRGLEVVSEADRLGEATVAAISDVLAMLRRITEARRGGVSRESQLRHLAAWSTAAPTDAAAHALFDAVFGLGRPRHVGVPHAAPESIATRRSWWDAPAVELSRTLVETGRPPGPGRPAAVARNEASRVRLRGGQLADQRILAEAAATLAERGAYDDVLDEARTVLLLRLLDVALAARASGAGAGARRIAGAAHGIRLALVVIDGTTTVRTARGLLHLDGYALEITLFVAGRTRPLVAASAGATA
jgi:uncharacterized protein (TIGR02677 family)